MKIEHIELHNMIPLKSPLTIFWELSSKCNLFCKHCYTNSSSKGETLKEEYLLKIMNQIIDLEILSIGFGGGEPLLSSSLCKLVYLAEKNDIKTSISTNGTLVNENIVKSLANAGLSIAQISIDGDEEVHDFLRGKGSFAKAIKTFELFKKHGIETRAAITLNNRNFSIINKTVKICLESGADIIVFFRYMPEGRNINNLSLSKEELIACSKSLIELEKKYSIGYEKLVFFTHLLDDTIKSTTICNAGYDILNIEFNGNVTLCPHSRNYVIGNVLKGNLKEIWDNWKNKMNDFYSTPKECLSMNCQFIPQCNGGCRGQSIKNNQAGIDPYCLKLN